MLDSPMHAIGARQDSFIYYGDRADWLVVIAETRDSDALERSNFRVVTEHLQEDYADDIAIERLNHWLCGWVDTLIVNPDNEAAVARAKEWRDKLAEYPVASDDDFSELEYEGAQETWLIAAHDAERIGHSAAPEWWESDNSGDYFYTCTKCGEDITVRHDGEDWHVPNTCVDDDTEDAGNYKETPRKPTALAVGVSIGNR